MFPEHFSFNKLLKGLLELKTCLPPGIRYMFYVIATKEGSFSCTKCLLYNNSCFCYFKKRDFSSSLCLQENVC